jgi:hypothetical protein
MVESYDEIKKKLDFIIKAKQTKVVENLLEKFPELQEKVTNIREAFNAAEEPGECANCRDEEVEIDEDTGLCEDCHGSSSDPREVHQWWLIDGEWAQSFVNNGMVILKAFDSVWFGRTCCGQSLHQDQELGFILKRKK